MDKFKFLLKRKLNGLPKTAGVYCFKSIAVSDTAILYIGKAINIQNRVKNHFQQPSYRDNFFIDKVIKIGFFETGSEIEALILEANLIKKYQPKYNVAWRDDKNYFYAAIAQNAHKIPYIYITHRKDDSKIQYIGPFVEGGALKKTLRFLRRVFPYYTSTLRHGSGQAIHPKNKCTWCHLNLCPGPDPDLIEYKKNVRKLVLILRGKRNAVLNLLKEEMKQLSKQKEFEKAARIRDRIFNLQQVMSHTNVINNDKKLQGRSLQWLKTQTILQGLLGIKKTITRIECYDVSNIQGKQATGSMVSAKGGPASGWVFDKSQYRKFRIKMKNDPNDIAMLKEILERRFSHLEWKYPDLMLIDGGIAQLNIAIKSKEQNPNSRDIKILSIAKRNNELFIENKNKPVLLKTLPREIFNLILQLRDEAHRFAIAYHKKLRKKQLFK